MQEKTKSKGKVLNSHHDPKLIGMPLLSSRRIIEKKEEAGVLQKESKRYRDCFVDGLLHKGKGVTTHLI